MRPSWNARWQRISLQTPRKRSRTAGAACTTAANPIVPIACRLVMERVIPIDVALLDGDILGVSRKVEHSHIRPRDGQFVRQPASTHFRHHHIGEQKGDSAAVGAAHLYGLFTAARRKHEISELLQHLDRYASD